MIIGNEQEFAIEYKEFDKKSGLGKVKVWIRGKPLGTFEDQQMASIIVSQFEYCFAKKKSIEVENSFESNEECMFKLQAEPTGKYFLSLGDAFDDFTVLIFYQNNYLYFVWKLENDPIFEYPGMSYEIYSEAIDLSYVKKVITAFKQQIKNN